MILKGKYIKTALIILSLFTICSNSVSYPSLKNGTRIEIISSLVRDRVIILDRVAIRSIIIVAFRISPKFSDYSKLTVRGELYHNGLLLSRDEIHHLDPSGNNLGFDIPLSNGEFTYEKPYGIPDGKYLVVIKSFDQNQKLIAQCQKELNRNQIGRTFYGFDKVYKQPRHLLVNDERETSKRIEGKRLEAKDHQTAQGKRQEAKGYQIFQRNYLERVCPNTVPEDHEMIKEISTEISRNEYKPLTFSIRALKDLKKVRIAVTSLRDVHGKTGHISMNIGAIGQLTEVTGNDDNRNIVYYQYAPKIIEYKEVIIPQHYTQTYWLTLKAEPEAGPGDYRGSIRIIPQSGRHTNIPIHVKVLPFRLMDTNKKYGMMMTYAFYEMDNDIWTKGEKDLIKKNGYKIYKDFREHGLTMVYPHSHFYLKYDSEGQPVLDSLRASLESYKNLAFPGPFCWYLGHLLQTAKPKHPGSILNYDSGVAKKRLYDLLLRFETMAKELGIPKEKLIVQLVDEPDRDDKERVNAATELHSIAREMGFKTMITRAWPDVDIICTSIPKNEEEAMRLKNMGKEWWIYPNNALNSKNLAYTRYVFGFGAWHWGVDGVVPWTFQMSQGSNGNPFTILDGPEIMVAYPGVNGPIPTPTWEAIRDGINDYKYIYLLEKMISAEKVRGNPVALRVEQQLSQIKNNLGKSPSPKEGEFGDWQPESFEKKRKQIVEWVLKLYRSTKDE